jgi:hypothetical protein
MPSPPFQTEKITISGTGALSLTVAQRASASLNLSVEKLVISPAVKYFNFRKPEPSSWWGWIQTVSRDFIIQDYELQYRRQLLLAKERNYYRAIEEIRCLIIAAERHTTDEVKFYATDSEADPIELAAELAEKVVNEVYSAEQWDAFLAANAEPAEIPLWVEDGIYYEIDEPYGALVTIRWQDFGVQCPVLPPPVVVPGPSSPSKDESRPGGGGGGGNQPSTPTPPGRGNIDNSDSGGPPSSGPGGPPSPSTGPSGPLPVGPYLVTIEIIGFQSGSAPCVEVAGARPTASYNVDPGPATVNKDTQPAGGYVWRLYDNAGVPLANISGASFNGDCDTIVNIVSQVYLGP